MSWKNIRLLAMDAIDPAKIRAVYDRPGSEGEKAAALGALRRRGIDPTKPKEPVKLKSGYRPWPGGSASGKADDGIGEFISNYNEMSHRLAGYRNPAIGAKRPPSTNKSAGKKFKNSSRPKAVKSSPGIKRTGMKKSATRSSVMKSPRVSWTRKVAKNPLRGILGF